MSGIESFADALFRPVLEALRLAPLPGMSSDFGPKLLLAVLLIAPMCAALSTQVVAFRMAFFSDAVAHSAYTGVALGVIAFGADASLGVTLAMAAVGVAVGAVVQWMRERTRQTPDTLIAIVLYGAVALGLVVVAASANKGLSATMGPFLFGTTLGLRGTDLLVLSTLALAVLAFQVVGFNRLMLIGLNPVLARSRGISTAAWGYAFSAALALVVTGSIRTVGVLVVGALLILPAASARNVARSMAGTFWWALAFNMAAAAIGLEISFATNAPMGASMVLAGVGLYAGSEAYRSVRRG